MKIHKIFTIDYSIAELLKQEDNASALVNNLLTSHYGDTRTEAEVLRDTKIKIKQKQDDIAKDKEFAKKLAKRTAKGIKQYKKTHDIDK